MLQVTDHRQVGIYGPLSSKAALLGNLNLKKSMNSLKTYLWIRWTPPDRKNICRAQPALNWAFWLTLPGALMLTQPEVLQVRGGSTLTPLYAFPRIPAPGLRKAGTLWFGVKLPLVFKALDHPSSPHSGFNYLPLPPSPKAGGQSHLLLPVRLPSPALRPSSLDLVTSKVCSSCPHPKSGTQVLFFCQLQT